MPTVAFILEKRIEGPDSNSEEGIWVDRFSGTCEAGREEDGCCG